MYATSDLYKTLLAEPLHYKETKIIINGVEYTESNIVSAVIPPSSLYENFGIGNCVARELDIEIFPIGVIPRQAEIKVFVRLVLGEQASEWVPQGEFFIANRKQNKLTGALVITAFDAMLKAEDTWLTDDYDLEDWPMTQQEAVEDIAYRMGVEVDPRTVLSDDFPVDYPVDENGDLTMREVLAGIGVSNAANWIISNEGKLLQVSTAGTLGSVSVGSDLSDMDVGEPARPVSKVILNLDGGTYYQSGDDAGNTIEADCPWATQAMADNVLAKVQGYVYQPFSGSEALLDPAAELGDAITVGGLTGTLALLGRNLDRQGAASIGAPGTDEIEDEYPYKSKQRRQTDRVLARTRAEIKKTADSIKLSVTNNEDGTSSYFELRVGETVLSSGNITFDGYVTFTGLENGTTTINGNCIKTGTILADLIKAGVLQSEDGETFVLDLDNGTFSMRGSGRFQSPNGSTYIEIEGDEMVMYSQDKVTGEYVDKIHFGFVMGASPDSTGGIIEYPYVLLGNAGSMQVGMVKKFYNGLWVGNSAPKDLSGNFEGMQGASGFFIDTVNGKTYVVNGTNMKDVYAGTTDEVVMTSKNVLHNDVILAEAMPIYLDQAEYDARVEAGSINTNTPYFIQKEV